MKKAIEVARALVAKWDANPLALLNAGDFRDYILAVVADAEAALPTIDEFIGSIPDVTDGKDSVAHVREMRGNAAIPVGGVQAKAEQNGAVGP